MCVVQVADQLVQFRSLTDIVSVKRTLGGAFSVFGRRRVFRGVPAEQGTGDTNTSTSTSASNVDAEATVSAAGAAVAGVGSAVHAGSSAAAAVSDASGAVPVGSVGSHEREHAADGCDPGAREEEPGLGGGQGCSKPGGGETGDEVGCHIHSAPGVAGLNPIAHHRLCVG